MAELGVGVLGASGRTTSTRGECFHAHPYCKIVACSSANAGKAEKFASEFDCRAYGDWQSVIKDPSVQAIWIATPASQHFEQAKLAMERGKDVLVDYPLCRSLDEADVLYELARKNRTVLHHGLQVRGEPAFIVALDAIPKLGRIACAHIAYFAGSRWRSKPELLDDVLLSVYLHLIDHLRGWFGEIKSLRAVRDQGLADDRKMRCAIITLEIDRCPLAVLELGVGYHRRRHYTMRILGSEGVLERRREVILSSAGRKRTIEEPDNTALKVDTDSFVRQALGGSNPLRDWDDGRRSLEVALDCMRAADAGEEIVYSGAPGARP